jgi:hypothetical protein
VIFNLGTVAVVSCLLVGCDNSGTSMSKNVGAHAVTVANAICREYNSYIYTERGLEDKGGQGSEPGQFLADREAEIGRLRAALSTTSESPQMRSYITSLVAEERLLAALHNEVKTGYEAYTHLALSKSYRDESRRLSLKLAAEARALGLESCIGPHPRRPIAG